MGQLCNPGHVSGIVGQVVDLGTTSTGITNAAAILAAIAVTIAGTSHLLNKAGIWYPRIPIPAFVISAAKLGHRTVHEWPRWLAPLPSACSPP